MRCNRRKLIIGLGATALGAPLASFAQKQPAKVYRIGVLRAGYRAATTDLHEAFKQALREHGYVEGQSVIFELRYGEGKAERLYDLAAELVRLKPDVLMAGTDGTIAVLKQATQTIPIVMVASTDPVGTGFVTSLARPGGNITGISQMSPELSGKRLELLKEVVAGLVRVAFLWNPDVRGALFEYKETEVAARALRLQLQSVEVRRIEEIELAFSAVMSQRAQGLIVQLPNPVLNAKPDQVVALAQKYRLPTMYGVSGLVNRGGLMSYGTNAAERWRHAAVFVDKIFKGAKPADLPVEQPTKFELVVNLKTAKTLGITIPQTVMVRADRVIQ